MKDDVIELCLRKALSRHELTQVNYQFYVNHHMDSLVVELKKSIQTKTFRRKVESSVPTTWWDHAKGDLLPRWIARRLSPPRLTRIETFIHQTLLPDR